MLYGGVYNTTKESYVKLIVGSDTSPNFLKLPKIEYRPEQDGKAYFGAWVELEMMKAKLLNSVLSAMKKFMVAKTIFLCSHLWQKPV